MATAFSDFMKARGLRDADLAPSLSLDRSMVSKIRRGVIPPTLKTAADIERITDGAVKMQAWAPIDHDGVSTPVRDHSAPGNINEVSAQVAG